MHRGSSDINLAFRHRLDDGISRNKHLGKIVKHSKALLFDGNLLVLRNRKWGTNSSLGNTEVLLGRALFQLELGSGEIVKIMASKAAS